MTLPQWTKKIIVIGLLGVLIVINLTFLVPEMGSFGLGILSNLNRTGPWRSALFARSGNFADYVIFLRKEIPENGIVILPPEEVSMWALADTSTMQFFLAPREIRNCTTVDCGAQFVGKENTYILIMGLSRFPGNVILNQENNIRMHNDTWGVFGSEEGLGHGTPPDDLSRLGSVVLNIILPVFSLLVLIIMGYYFASVVLPELPAWSRVGIGYGVLMGAYSISCYLLLFLGLTESLKICFFLITSLFVGILIFAVQKKVISLDIISELFDWGSTLDIWTILIVILGGLFVFLAVGAGFHTSDAYVLWGAKAVGLVAEGLSGVITRGTNTTIYPLHIPMLIGMFLDTFGDILPAAKLFFPLYYLSLLLVVYGFFKERADTTLAGLSTLVLATIPLLARHARIGYANLPLTFYLVVGVILFIRAISESDAGFQRVLWIMSGVFYALAIWTRPEGLVLVIGILIASLSWLLFFRKRNPIHKVWLIGIAPLLLWVGWKITSSRFYIGIDPVEGNLETLLQQFSKGNYHLKDFSLILRYFWKQLYDFQTWGAVGVGSLAAIVVFILTSSKQPIKLWILWMTSASILVIIVAIYFVFAFDPSNEMDWWLTSGFNRMIMPGMTLLWLGAARMLHLSKISAKK
ncbi:MAG: glycosyltransferase family 39 protein [Anaerolineales bacterium]